MGEKWVNTRAAIYFTSQTGTERLRRRKKSVQSKIWMQQILETSWKCTARFQLRSTNRSMRRVSSYVTSVLITCRQ
jgi:hypothetical protein